MAEATDLIPLINGIEYSWGDITATVGGVPVVGITAIEYGDDQVVAYIPEDGQIVTDKIMNCRFKKNARNWKEGDTRQLVDLELVPSHIKWHNK